MALGQTELKRCEMALAAFMARRRPPVDIRGEVDLGYRISVMGDAALLDELGGGVPQKVSKVERLEWRCVRPGQWRDDCIHGGLGKIEPARA